MIDERLEQESGEELTRPAGSVLSCAGRAERMLFDDGNFSIGRRSDPVELVLAGEIDFPSVPHLTAALLDATGRSAVLHVDLADVYFCDLAALRTIIGLGLSGEDQQPPYRARSVILHNVPAHIEKILQITGWDTTPGLAIDRRGTTA